MKIEVLDIRPRRLGMFAAYPVANIGAEFFDLIPSYGVLDHLVPCECKYAAANPHPKFLAVAAYVKVFGRLLSISWPTWFPL